MHLKSSYCKLCSEYTDNTMCLNCVYGVHIERGLAFHSFIVNCQVFLLFNLKIYQSMLFYAVSLYISVTNFMLSHSQATYLLIWLRFSIRGASLVVGNTCLQRKIAAGKTVMCLSDKGLYICIVGLQTAGSEKPILNRVGKK